MTPQIAATLAILVIAILLIVSERIRMDVIALLVLVTLALSGLVTPSEALSGFSNPAVVTVWAVFILSGGLARTGIASLVGSQILRLAGDTEVRLMVVIMLAASLMSAFMNNVGVAALLLPVVMDIARQTGRVPSKLLMPLAFGALLGGLTTLIGTPPNILISDALAEAGLAPLQMFDFAPVGLAAMLTGVIFMVLAGRHLLPVRDPAGEGLKRGVQTDPKQFYDLSERLFVTRLPKDSMLAGKTLRQSRLGTALNLNVIGVIRDQHTHLSPDPSFVLKPNDRLLVTGRLDRLDELSGREHLVIESQSLPADNLVSAEIGIAEVGLSPRASILGSTLQQIDFRRRYGAIVLALWRGGVPLRTEFDNIALRAGDLLLVQAPHHQMEALRSEPGFLVSEPEKAKITSLHERLLAVSIPEESSLVDKTLEESHIAQVFGLAVLGIIRKDGTHLMPAAEEKLQAHDTLLVKGKIDAMQTMRGLKSLEIDRKTQPDLRKLETERVGLSEVVLSPHTTLAGKTLRQIHFREKYGLSVLAIWRGGRSYRSNLRDMELRFGDALLVYGAREQLKVLGSDPDFLVLTGAAQEPARLDKAPLAALVMAAVLIPVILNWLPISIAAVAGAVMMVLLGCLTMEEAYRFIEWKAVFLIAGMLPLGIALEHSGAARFIADSVVSVVGRLGPLAVIAGLYLLATLATQVMPNAAVAVLLAPIALSTAGTLHISPYSLMITIALATSASFLSPVAHPANVLIMGPGGYRFSDFIKVGLPLTVCILLVTLVVLPLVWPLVP
ncbi:MAG TPA: SLC13 family permease [Anaerolineales bacterium]|nr:SLC13 family permease [Anaerolineales bacterium]